MPDIKLTLSQKKALRSTSIQEEAAWMEKEGPIYYNVGANKPLHAESGCWVYFIRGGNLVARSKAEDFRRSEEIFAELVPETYTGVEQDPKPQTWRVVCRKMEIASRPIPHESFQGFRYVRPEEQARFETAFEHKKK